MQLSSVLLTNFRNHKELFLELPNTIYISGDNGSGKTSIIEAIYLLLTHKSFRQSAVQEIRTFGEDFLRVEGKFTEDSFYESVVYFFDDKKSCMINGDKNANFIEFSHALPVICYSPSFETVLSAEHKDRRAFLDRAFFYLDKSHVNTVQRYNKILLRKRAELQLDNPNIDILRALNEQLRLVSDTISNARLRIIDIINSYLTDFSSDLVSNNMLIYIHINSIDDDKLEMEIERKIPLCGCHKDLVYMKQNGKTMEKFQSFGQKKSFLLLVLYFISLHIGKTRDANVLLLLDDFEAGLDNNRAKMLYELFYNSDFNRQIILSGVNTVNDIKQFKLN